MGTQSVPPCKTIKTYRRFITIQGSVPAAPKNPIMISSRPTVRRLDTVSAFPLNQNQGYALGGVLIIVEK
ncbi:MAG: hypothetical protein ACTHOO_10710 [Alcanivorax sp.]